MKRVHLVISGDVQGVNFRSWARGQAQGKLVGWIKNRKDGAVEVVAEGSRDALENFVAACQHGPEIACPPSLRSGAGRRAWVENVDVKWQEATGEFMRFEVVY